MNKRLSWLFLMFVLLESLSCSNTQQNKIIEQQSGFQSNPDWLWVLTVPENTEPCQLWLSFADNGELKFSYRGFIVDGTYQFDPELPQYLYINIPTRFDWNDDCKITPDYLSLYNDNTDFAWTMTGDFLYFRKMDKVLKFKKEVIS
jgi:hypothetical protein